jgi:hypothetical protein
MSRPPLEVADLIRIAGVAFLERNRHCSAGSTLKCCGPLRGVVPPHSAAISMSAPAAVIAPSLTTLAATATAPSVKRAPAIVGSQHVDENFSRRVTFMWSSRFLVS